MNDHPKSKELAEHFAVLMCGIIQSDSTITEQEKKKFDDFFSQEFAMDPQQIEELYTMAIEERNYDERIARLREILTDIPMIKLRFVDYLNKTILSDGIGDGEYALFEKVRDGLI